MDETLYNYYTFISGFIGVTVAVGSVIAKRHSRAEPVALIAPPIDSTY